MMGYCSHLGLMASCQQSVYGAEDEFSDDNACYYHSKIRDGVLKQEQSYSILDILSV